MHILLILVLGLIMSARAAAQEAPSFECVASIGQLHYQVELSHSVLGHRMRVGTEAGMVADGPASSYREGTRFFVSTGPGQGLKLTIDQDPARICFDAGGRDCYACERVPVLARTYDDIVICPNAGFTLEAHRVYGSYDDMVIKDAAGDVIASGPGVESGRHATIFSLQTGPGEFYQATWDYASEEMPCTTVALTASPSSPLPTADAVCVVGDESARSVSFSLLREGRVRFAKYYYNQYSYMIGPVTEIEQGRWLLSSPSGEVSYRQVDGTTGEICDLECVACALSDPSE